MTPHKINLYRPFPKNGILWKSVFISIIPLKKFNFYGLQIQDPQLKQFKVFQFQELPQKLHQNMNSKNLKTEEIPIYFSVFEDKENRITSNQSKYGSF